MLPRRKRVGKELFDLIFKKGASFHSPHLSLKVLTTRAGGRFSVVAGKKAASGAAERNRLRRQGYALMQKYLDSRTKTSGIVFVKKKALRAVLEGELQELLKRGGVQ